MAAQKVFFITKCFSIRQLFIRTFVNTGVEALEQSGYIVYWLCQSISSYKTSPFPLSFSSQVSPLHSSGVSFVTKISFSTNCPLNNAIFNVVARDIRAPAENCWGDARWASLLALILRGAANHPFHGSPHLIIFVWINNWIHDRVQQGQEKEPPFNILNPTVSTVQAIKQQDDQARGPADNKGT